MIQLLNVTKIYSNGVQALNDINMTIEKGEFAFLVGPSGAGKSTLLKLLLREEVPTKGQILINGRSTVRFNRGEIAGLRRSLGVVFQDFRLLTERTVFENVAFAMQVLEHSKREIRRRVPMVLELVGLEGKSSYFPHQLSGGEQQRVAIARAIVNGPKILIADEPTGNLDPDTSWGIMDLLQSINFRGTTVVMATHDRPIVDKMRKRVIALERGQVIRDEERGFYGYES
ncbi:cell division ATP-binding protein FtsE [Bacillota bacterium LX-D]|nr:cell division ATP-binding protein FtsE [Bacillota bacterium LX-D]